MTRSQEFISKNRRKLVDGPDFFNPDTSLMPAELYESSKLKVLFVFPTCHSVKTVSSTAAALLDIVVTSCPDVFVDFAYMPDAQDLKLYDDAQIPYAIGHSTHLDASHFDMVGFSISVLSEIVNCPVMLKSFERCDKPIPLFWTQRKDLPIGSHPILYCGGITAACGDIMFGKVGNEQAFLDFQYLGAGERTNLLTSRLIEALSTNKVTRKDDDRDVYGYAHEEIKDFTLEVSVNTIQDYVESLFDLNWIYQPQAYEVTFNSKTNQIVSNKKINPKARDWVRPYYPHKLEEELGIGRTIINASGDNTGTTQTQVSEGCSAGGQCSFMVSGDTRIWTNCGILRIEDVSKPETVQGVFAETCNGVVCQGTADEYKVITHNGHQIKVSNDHRFMVVVDGNLVEKRTYELHHGDVILRKVGAHAYPNYVDNSEYTHEEFAELLGFMHGDGCFDHKQNRWKIYMSDGELPHYEYLFRKFVNTSYKTRIHYKGTKGNIWVIEGKALSVPFDIADTACSELYVPDFIFKSPKSVVCSYLRGIFQADGWFTDTIGLTSISEKYVHDIALLLSYVGIDCSVKYNGCFDRTPMKGHKASWYIHIPRDFHAKFIEDIGFITKNKQVQKTSNRSKANLRNTLALQNLVRDTFGSRATARAWGLGDLFESPRDYISDRVFRRIYETPLYEKLPEDSVFRMIASGQFVTDKIESVNLTGKVVDMYDVIDTETHLCVYESILTHQCSEGAYTGGWVEKSRDRILHEIKEAKKYSAGYKFKPFSFNCNYVTDYKGLLKEFIQIYPKVTFINMRMEELGRDTDALKMMKLIGSNRISAPIEGLSPRIQNNLLNKCLSEESLRNFMDDMVHMKLTDIKVGGIFTGYEEDEDFQWICDFVDSYKKRAAKEGGNFPFRLKCCATDDALTPVPGKGLLRQSLLTEGPVIGYEESNIIATQPQGYSELVEITTNFGNSVKVTFEHPVLTKYTGHSIKEEHYTKAKDIKAGMTIYSRIGTNAYGPIQHFAGFTLDKELAAVLGWYMGDGYSNVHDNYKTHGHCFNIQEASLQNNIKTWYIEHGFNPRPHYMGLKQCTAFRVHNAKFTRELVKEFGHTAHGKKVSQLILSSPKEVQCVFLAWWFAADGTVINDSRGNYNSRIRLYSANKQVLADAQAMMFNMGIIAILSGHKTKCLEKEFYTYQLEIKSTSVPLFTELIKIPGNKQNLIRINNHRGSHCIKSNGFIKNKVKRIDLLPEEPTYGVEITNHSYVTNGILSHNTPLVSYPLTACEYIERKSAKKSMLGEHWLTDEWYEKFREHNVFFKVNGFRYSTFLEQSLVDRGRDLTEMVYHHFIKNLIPISSLRSMATDEFVAELKSKTNPETFFEARDPEHYISIAHRIHIELMGSYIPRARRLVRAYKNGNIFDNQMDIRCLKTFDGAKTKCYANCIKDEPLKIYNDVEMDEQGNLKGEYRLLYGCERCATPELKKARLARPTPQTATSEDIEAMPRIPQVQKIRFILKRNPEYDILNPNNTAHTFITKFLQLSDNLLDAYHSIQCHNMFWQSDEGVKYYTGGHQIIDTIWSKKVFSEIQSLIPQVNSLLKSTQVVSATEELMDEKIKVDDVNVFYFESDLPFALFEASRHTYDGSIKIYGGMGVSETIKDDKLMQPIFASKGKIKGFFAIPTKYNPNEYLAGFLSAKKTTSNQVIQTTRFECVMTMRQQSTVCKNCGKEQALISLITGKPMPFGPECLCKALLSMKLK